MLARYQMRRGHAPTVQGIRQDTRKHTRHCLRPGEQMVREYLAFVSAEAWGRFEQAYLKLLDERFAENRQSFEALAELARQSDVYLGCSCPTAKNPNVMHCHTTLALRFMQAHYSDLSVVLPQESNKTAS